jgi:hypothetical protein
METIHSILAVVISPDAMNAMGDVWTAITALMVASCAVVGAISKLVVALRYAARLFKAWASTTPTLLDDAAAVSADAFLAAAGAKLDSWSQLLGKYALNDAGKAKS